MMYDCIDGMMSWLMNVVQIYWTSERLYKWLDDKMINHLNDWMISHLNELNGCSDDCP